MSSATRSPSRCAYGVTLEGLKSSAKSSCRGSWPWLCRVRRLNFTPHLLMSEGEPTSGSSCCAAERFSLERMSVGKVQRVPVSERFPSKSIRRGGVEKLEKEHSRIKSIGSPQCRTLKSNGAVNSNWQLGAGLFSKISPDSASMTVLQRQHQSASPGGSRQRHLSTSDSLS